MNLYLLLLLVPALLVAFGALVAWVRHDDFSTRPQTHWFA